MSKQLYEVVFTREEQNYPLHKELKPRHGFQFKNFTVDQNAMWSGTAKILVSEIRKLKSKEELAFLSLVKRLDEKDQGRGVVSCCDQYMMLGINVLLREIIRLQKQLDKKPTKRFITKGR